MMICVLYQRSSSETDDLAAAEVFAPAVVPGAHASDFNAASSFCRVVGLFDMRINIFVC